MKTIAAINQKGGVAKSTTAHILGSMLARDGKRVLFVDLDAQGNLTYSLGGDGAVGVFDVLSGSRAPADAIETVGGFSLLGSSSALATADISMTATGKEYRLKEALEKVAGDFDYCVIDTPPALGILTVNALTAADGVIIPAQADVFSLQGIKQLGETISTVRRYCNQALRIYGVLLVRYSKRAVISREVADYLAGAADGIGARLFKTAIRECTAVKEAQATRKGLLDYAPSSNAALDYMDFFKELKEVL